MNTFTIKEEKKNFRIFCLPFNFIRFRKCEKEFDPEFIEKIKKGEQQVKEGKTTKIDPSNVWKSLK